MALQSQKIDIRVLWLALGTFALGTDSFVMAGVLPSIAHDMGVTESVAGQLVTVFALAYAAGAPVLAAITARWPRHRVLLSSLGVFCLANIGSAIAPNFRLLLLSRVLAGCCAALYSPMAYALGTSLAPSEKRGKALALVASGLMLATVFGSPAGTWVGEHFGWRFSFSLVVFLAGLACFVLLVVGVPGDKENATLSLKERLVPMREPRMLLALSPTLFGYLGIYLLYTYLGISLQQSMHLTDISGYLLVFGIGNLIGNWLAGFMTDRLGSARPMIMGQILVMLCLVLFSFASFFPIGALLTLLCLGIVMPSFFAPQQHRLLHLAPQHANVLLALNNSMLYLGIGSAGAIGGLLLHYAPALVLGPIGALSVLLALLLLLLSLWRSKRVQPVEIEQDVEKVA
uniref:MFS transporter n=1 Tax=Thermosporothrix sp. COM3 TaxID=2490863 RepID=A0A455SFT7_9CHLR|nr:MFS transporter [Thermosporothrix sp. COM3]